MSDKKMVAEKGREWIAGGVLILMGTVFFLTTFDVVDWGRAWIIFALIPVAGVLYWAWCQYQANGRRLSGSLLVTLMWSLFPFAFVLGAWADVNVGRIWPIVFVLAGVTVLVNRREDSHAG